MKTAKSGRPETVLDAVDRELDALAERAQDLADSALAASARALAREIDGQNSATSKSMCARALQDAMRELRELAPPKQERDRIDELAAARSDRAARVARTASQ